MYTLACLYNTYIQVHGPGGFSRLFTGLLSSQGETGINFVFFIVVPLRKKVLKYGTPKPSLATRKYMAVRKGLGGQGLGFRI